MINITNPEVFIDAQTGISLNTSHDYNYIKLEKQFSASELELIEEQKAVA